MNIADELRQLHDLHQAGALTAEEFAYLKSKLLAGERLESNPGKSSKPKKPRSTAKPSGPILADVFGGLMLGGILGAVVSCAACTSAKMNENQGMTMAMGWGFLGALIGAIGNTGGRFAIWIAWFAFFGALVGAITIGPAGILFFALIGAVAGGVLAALNRQQNGR